MTEPVVVDTRYLNQPEFAAAFLLREGREAAFVETNTVHALPALLEALAGAGLAPGDVRWIIVTHVHLDHAGGASALLAACPNATLLAHPRAAPHLIDPSRLVASARKVYGDETFRALYGEIAPAPAERVRALADGETLRWGGRTLTFAHTRGHANHHFAVHDSADGAVFSGDAFGLRYPRLQSAGLFLFPSTSPTDFDPVEAKRAVDRIAALASRVYLTHYGRLDDVRGAAAQLHEHLDFAAGLLERAAAGGGDEPALGAFCRRELEGHFERALARRGLAMDEDAARLLRMDVELNAQGIAYAALRRRAKG